MYWEGSKLRLPPGSTVKVSGNVSTRSFSLGRGKLSVWLDPGEYLVLVSYNGVILNRTVRVGAGEAPLLEFTPSDFTISTTTTTTGTLPSATSTTSTPAQTTTTSSATVTSTETATSTTSTLTYTSSLTPHSTTPVLHVESKSPGFPTTLIIIGLSAIVVSALALAGLRGRRGSGEPGVPGESPGLGPTTPPPKPSTPPSPTLGLSGLSGLRGVGLGGLRVVDRCSRGFKTVLHPSIAPRGFEGEWICCRLGCGGWGCAYRCEGDGRIVVFKVPRGLEGLVEEGVPPTVSEVVMRKVRDNAVTLARLVHPHILRLLAYSERAPLLVYEYADMGTLEDQVSMGWKPRLKDAVLLGIQLGDALRYIHSRGLVHGDVKPGNVFFRDSVVKLGDFSSIVRLVTMTTSQPLAYTPGWRAPEQVYSDLKRKALSLGVENRIDVYQLGNLLLYLLAGDFIDGEEAFDQNRVNKPLGRIEHEDLRRLLSKMLSPEPAERPSMDTVVEELIKIYNSLQF